MSLSLIVNTTTPLWMPERPDAIYGAAIGGAIALLTAFLTNRNARKRQAQDLNHSSTEKDKERHYTLKRETYLPLLEASSSAIAFVMQIPTVPIEQLRAQEPMLQLARLIARLGVIAPAAVQEPVQKSHKLLTELCFKLINERWVIESVAAELASIDFDVQLRLNRQKELQLRQEKHIDAKTGNDQLILHLFEQHRIATREIDELLSRRGPLIRKKLELELELARRAAADILGIAAENCEVLIAIRQELGMSSDEEWIRRFTRASADDYRAATQKFQDDLKKRFVAERT
jgi:hypothetical protein